MLGSLGGGGVIGRAVVELVGDSAKLQKDVASAQGQVTKSTGAMGKATSSFGAISKVAMLAAGAAVLKFGADSLKVFREAQMVQATTAATIKATGGAANVTAKEVAALSTEMMEYAVVDDEVIQQGQNLLLTFKAIRNEAGEGNQVFDEASRLMLDLALAMNRGSREGLDMKATALQLGKALADPVAGLTALKKAGVDFTAQQREQITAMHESGDTLGAQKAILAEVRSQVGGLARETAASVPPAQRLALQWEEFQEKIGALIAEGIGPLMENLGKLIGVLEQVGGVVGTLGGEIDKISLRTFASEISGAAEIAPRLSEALAEMVRTGQMSVEQLANALPQLNEQLSGIDKAGQLSVVEILRLAGASDAATGSAGKHAAAEADRAAQMEKAADAARAEHAALLSLAGGFLAVEGASLDAKDSQLELAEAQAEVNKMTDKGKKGTEEWRAAQSALRQAQLGAVQSQLDLAQAVADYIGEVGEGKAEQSAAIAQIREFGRSAGLSQADVSQLVNRVLDLVRAQNQLKDKTVTITTVFKRIGTPSGAGGHQAGTAAGGILAAQAGGITQGPVVMVGEGSYRTFAGKGSEAVIPLDDRGLGILADAIGIALGRLPPAGGGGPLVVQQRIDGGPSPEATAAEAVRMLRDATKRRDI